MRDFLRNTKCMIWSHCFVKPLKVTWRKFYAQPTSDTYIMACISIGFCRILCKNRTNTNVQSFCVLLRKTRKINWNCESWFSLSPFTIFVGRFSIKFSTWVYTKHSFRARFLIRRSSYLETPKNKRIFGQLIVLLISQFKLWVSSLCFAKHGVYKLSRNFQIRFVLAVTSTSLCKIYIYFF